MWNTRKSIDLQFCSVCHFSCYSNRKSRNTTEDGRRESISHIWFLDWARWVALWSICCAAGFVEQINVQWRHLQSNKTHSSSEISRTQTKAQPIATYLPSTYFLLTRRVWQVALHVHLHMVPCMILKVHLWIQFNALHWNESTVVWRNRLFCFCMNEHMLKLKWMEEKNRHCLHITQNVAPLSKSWLTLRMKISGTDRTEHVLAAWAGFFYKLSMRVKHLVHYFCSAKCLTFLWECPEHLKLKKQLKVESGKSGQHHWDFFPLYTQMNLEVALCGIDNKW